MFYVVCVNVSTLSLELRQYCCVHFKCKCLWSMTQLMKRIVLSRGHEAGPITTFIKPKRNPKVFHKIKYHMIPG